jgi:lipopolysaccharide biosynthesis regulator YciM
MKKEDTAKRFTNMTIEQIEALSHEDLSAFVEQVCQGLEDHPEINVPSELRDSLKKANTDLKQAVRNENEALRRADIADQNVAIEKGRFDRTIDAYLRAMGHDNERGH